MRFRERLLLALLIVGVSGAGVALARQSEFVRPPFLGFIQDSAGAVIWPIIGVPGASVLGNPLELEADISDAIISPTQDFAIAVQKEDRRAVVISLASGSIAFTSIPGTQVGADLIAISPTGSAAAIFSEDSRIIRVVGHLPQAPVVMHEFDASGIPGRGTGIAISDDGATSLIRFVDDESVTLWMVDSTRAWRIPADRPSASAFFPNNHDAVVADDATQSVFLVMDAGATATQLRLTSAPEGINGFSSVAVSADGRQIFLTDDESATLLIVDVETRTSKSVSCQCRPTGLSPLRGKSVYGLTRASRDPVAVLDASSGEPRIVVIPPDSSRRSMP
jgi:DNA-binding beta-propeller fold protein YncE